MNFYEPPPEWVQDFQSFYFTPAGKIGQSPFHSVQCKHRPQPDELYVLWHGRISNTQNLYLIGVAEEAHEAFQWAVDQGIRPRLFLARIANELGEAILGRQPARDVRAIVFCFEKEDHAVLFKLRWDAC